jgi:hypothetical protein
MKCGTSSLHQYLGEHPQVCVSTPKETDFFLARNEKNLAWYRGCFPEPARAYGEVSPNYTKHPTFAGVPGRMHEILPEVKLIYLVRDPVEQAVSHYVHNWVRRRWSTSIRGTMLPVEESWPLTVSRYHMQLSQYLEYYSMRDTLVLQSERLRRRPREVMEELFRFIGVDPCVARKGDAFEEEHNVSTEKARKKGLAAFLTESALGRAAKNAGKRLVPRRTIEWAKEALWSEVEKPTLDDDVRARVRDDLQNDVEQLRALTGKEFRGWSV